MSVTKNVVYLFADYTEIPEVNYQRNTNVSENFTQINEENSGQLYAYRLDPNTIYLGTRNVRELGASIGIQRIASGVYRCVARNGNENDTKSLTVAVECKYQSRFIVLFKCIFV